MNGLNLTSEFCLNPNQCYPVKTEIPAWLLIILIGSTYLIAKEIFIDLKLNS